MKKFEVFTQSSNTTFGNNPIHILEAERFNFANGVYFFYDEKQNILHAVVAIDGMLVRTPS